MMASQWVVDSIEERRRACHIEFKLIPAESRRMIVKLVEIWEPAKKIVAMCNISYLNCNVVTQANLELNGVISYLEALGGERESLDRAGRVRYNSTAGWVDINFKIIGLLIVRGAQLLSPDLFRRTNRKYKNLLSKIG